MPVACADPAAQSPSTEDRGASPTEALPDPEAAYGLPTDALVALHRRAAVRAAAHEGTPQGVEASRAAAGMARVLAVRERDQRWVERARDHLALAGRRRDLEGACEASLDRARLEAVDAASPGAAYLEAYRAQRRFEPERDAHAECLSEIRRLLAVLAPHRPSAQELARVDAAPEDEAAPAGDERGGGDGDVRTWARGRIEEGASRLERVSVFGAAGSGAGSVDMVRVVLGLDRVALFQTGEAEASADLPRRFYVDLEGTSIGDGVPASRPVGAAGLLRVRVAEPRARTTRVVFDLEGEVVHSAFFLSDPFRIVVDFDRRPPRAGAAAVPGAVRPLDIIVIDPGHGGDEHGARHGGLRESHLTLDLSERMAAILRTRLPSSRILLTRHADQVVSLEERVAFANSVRADVFVSVHLNAADDPVEHGGVATFVLDVTDDRQALLLAARENGTSAQEVSGLQRLLASIHRSDQLGESRALATLVQAGTLEGGRRVLPTLPDRGVKSATFYVLVGARMPAILLEASFLTQAQENRALATERYRQALAEGAAEGVVRYARGD